MHTQSSAYAKTPTGATAAAAFHAIAPAPLSVGSDAAAELDEAADPFAAFAGLATPP